MKPLLPMARGRLGEIKGTRDSMCAYLEKP